VDNLRKQIDLIVPDLTFLITVNPSKAIVRVKNRIKSEINRFDDYPLSYHQKVHEGYQLLLKKYPKRIVAVNNEESKIEFAAEICYQHILKIMKKNIS
jgi:dTMP kinase